MRVLIAAVLIANVSCSSSPTDPVDAAATVTLRYGETTTIAGTHVSFTEIVDSRCPKDVVCVWAGDAGVRLDSGTESVVLHTNPTAVPAEGKLAGVTITLIEVKPERVGPNPAKSEYVVTLLTSR